MKTKTTLQALYSFPGFRALSRLKGILGNSPARVVTLMRRQKKRRVPSAMLFGVVSMTGRSIGSVIWTPAEPASSWTSSTDDCSVGAAEL